MSAGTNPPPLTQELRRIADQIRVKVHLAGMDAKDAWAKLEPRLHKYERKAETTADMVASDVVQLGRDLKRDLATLLDDLKRPKQPGA